MKEVLIRLNINDTSVLINPLMYIKPEPNTIISFKGPVEGSRKEEIMSGVIDLYRKDKKKYITTPIILGVDKNKKLESLDFNYIPNNGRVHNMA